VPLRPPKTPSSRPPRDTAWAMSEENVEIVRRSFAAYDSGGLDAVAEFWRPDIEWRAVEGYIDDVGVIRGPDEPCQPLGP
jgi:ketosteroid isomerase-like protein